MIKLSRPQIDSQELKAVKAVFKSGQLAQGLKVKEFETKFANYIGVKYAAAVNSGTSALQLACQALGLSSNHEVITTPFSFIASSTSILYTGARPVFADIDDQYNLDPDKVVAKINANTKAILVVHLYGNPAKMIEINKIAKRYNLLVIEDAAQAHGSKINGQKVGTFSDIACFSFYPTKNMTTIEGGMVVSNHQKLIEKVKLLRNQGAKTRYHHSELSYNFRMTEVSAAVGIEQLKKLDKFNKIRNQNAAYLNKLLSKIVSIETPSINTENFSNFHQYTIRVKKPLNRDRLAQYLSEKGIETAIFYPIPIYRQKLDVFKTYSLLPNTELAIKEVLSLPVHPSLTKKDLKKIVSIIQSFVNGIKNG